MVSVEVDKNLSYLSTVSNINLRRWTLKEAILEMDQSDPNRVLYVFNQNEGLEVTVSNLKENAMRLAQNYLKLGVQKGDRIAYFSKNTSELVYSYFAAGFIGAINVPIDSNFPIESLDYIFNKVEPKILVYFNDENIDKLVKALLQDSLASTNSNDFESKKFPYLQNVIAIERIKGVEKLPFAVSFKDLLEKDLDGQLMDMPYVDSDDNLYILFSVFFSYLKHTFFRLKL